MEKGKTVLRFEEVPSDPNDPHRPAIFYDDFVPAHARTHRIEGQDRFIAALAAVEHPVPADLAARLAALPTDARLDEARWDALWGDIETLFATDPEAALCAGLLLARFARLHQPPLSLPLRAMEKMVPTLKRYGVMKERIGVWE